jgi:hypothetical protein
VISGWLGLRSFNEKKKERAHARQSCNWEKEREREREREREKESQTGNNEPVRPAGKTGFLDAL